MHPIFFSLGPVTIYYFSFFFLLASAVFSFIFWQRLRDRGVDEEKIFDLTLYSALLAFIGARAAFVATHWSDFSSDYLRIIAIWVTPGLSLYGGFLVGSVAAYILLKSLKLRLSWVLDAFAFSFPLSLSLGRLGALLDGSEVGRPTPFPFGVYYVGHTALRHPVQLYETFGLLLIFIAFLLFSRSGIVKKLSPGSLGPISIALASFWFFSLEFFKEGSVYWANISPNQWLLVFIFAQSLGMILIRAQSFVAYSQNFYAGLKRQLRNTYKKTT